MIFCCRCGTLLIGNTSTNKSADVSPNDGHSNIHANSDTNAHAYGNPNSDTDSYANAYADGHSDFGWAN